VLSNHYPLLRATLVVVSTAAGDRAPSGRLAVDASATASVHLSRWVKVACDWKRHRTHPLISLRSFPPLSTARRTCTTHRRRKTYNTHSACPSLFAVVENPTETPHYLPSPTGTTPFHCSGFISRDARRHRAGAQQVDPVRVHRLVDCC